MIYFAWFLIYFAWLLIYHAWFLIYLILSFLQLWWVFADFRVALDLPGLLSQAAAVGRV